ncbi:hypothetical protein L207DRAFT_617981 [Hyaloscypha variabilis F]|uniref:Mid2 domain-containing protein n=1 Tax=Hyaloscypha variabilis (strain UAMH 11265 / GT02V1 / F) TaxID=1149755 RepID=A0A2J6QSA9_HYAVF|nr:hypothetical protein L207DRAFT_617981 [Hyaloscypha variabilis F]
MMVKLFRFFSLLLLARLGLGEAQLAERVPQLLIQRSSFLGGISLYAETPTTGVDGVCPSYTQTCSDSCCPDGCCPPGTFCVVNGDYCCPTSAASPYFCCEPNQVALLPNLCVAGSSTSSGASLAPSAIQAQGNSLATVVTSLVTISLAPSVPASITTRTVSIAGSGSSSTSTVQGGSNEKSGLSIGAKVGIGIGAGLASLLLFGLCKSRFYARANQKTNDRVPSDRPPAYTDEYPLSRVDINMSGSADAREPSARRNYSGPLSEMPGAEAQMGHELSAEWRGSNPL